MGIQQVLYAVERGIATITLNRPEKMNALTPAMTGELRAAMERASEDATVRVVILTGAGRAFCAGGDITRSKNGDPGEALPITGAVAGGVSLPQGYGAKYAWISTVSKPVIAAINGAAVGTGLALALHCDLRFAVEGAKLSTMFAKRGLVTEYAMAWMLPRLIGPSNALDLALSARFVLAEEALSMGLVDRVVAPQALMSETLAYAGRLVSEVSPRSARVIKQLIYRSLDQGIDDAVAEALEQMADASQSADYKEGVAAWREGRPPSFTGK